MSTLLNRIRSTFGAPAWVVLILAPLVLFWRIVFAGRVLFWGVPLLQFYPWQQYAAEMWKSGHVPLWNPLVGNGAPLAANLQSAVFYPLNALYLVLPAEHAMGVTAVLHVILAGLAMSAWARAYGLRPLAGLVAGLAFQLSQFLIARFGFLSITATFPWTAVWLWRTEVLVQRRRLSDTVWLAVSIGLGLLAGHAQTAGLGLIVVVAYAALRTWQTRRQSRIGRTAFYGVAALVLGLALAAVQMLPSLELASQSQRAGGLDYYFAVTHSLHPLRLLSFLAPDLMGNPADDNFWGYDNYWENAGYLGVWALLMAGFALVGAGKGEHEAGSGGRLIAWFWGVTALVALVIALGRFMPFFPFLFRVLPGVALFQGPARLLSTYTLAVAALAGIGTEQLLQGERLHRSGRILLVAALGILVAVVTGTTLTGLRAVFVRPVIQFAITLAACAAALAWRPSERAGWRFTVWQAALVGIVALDLIVADWRLNPTTDPSLYRNQTASAQAIQAAGQGRTFWFAGDEEKEKFSHYLSFQSFGPQDTGFWLGMRESLLPNAAMIEAIPAANNFDSLLVGPYSTLLARLNSLPRPDALRLAGIMDARYILSPGDQPLPVVWRGDQVTIYRNNAALGRAWIVPEARAPADTLAALADPSFDPRQAVLLPAGSLPPATLNAVQPAGSRPATVVLQDSPNTVTIRAASDSSGFLVLADTFYPGWQATVDGRPVPILRANYAFRAVALQPGEHTVIFHYEPPMFRLGALISLSALIAVLAAWLVPAFRQAWAGGARR